MAASEKKVGLSSAWDWCGLEGILCVFLLILALNHEGEHVLSMHKTDSDTPDENLANIISPVQCPPSVNEKALMRKIDRRLLPMLFIVYTAAFLDR